MDRRTSFWISLALFAGLLAQAASAAKPAELWEVNYNAALAKAKKENRVVIACFRGSDWDPWTQKLDKEVLRTPAFEDWARNNVVLLDVDLPSPAVRQPASIKAQNEGLKDRFNIVRTPTFVFLDPQGEEIDRCGYDAAKLRPEEKTGQPTAWLAYVSKAIAARPDGPKLLEQPDLSSAIAFSKKKARAVVLLLARPDAPKLNEISEKVLTDPRFIRFANRQLSFVRLTWPADEDRSKPAEALRAFAKTFSVPNAPLQFVVYDPGRRKVTDRVTQINPAQVDTLVRDLEKALPTIDYTGGWLEDYNAAKTIAQQQNRDILIVFTDMERSEFSKKLDAEVFKTDAFRDYAAQNLVLVRADFSPSKEAAKSAALKEQHKTLVDLHGVRGYPFIVVVNPKFQKIGEAKYMKGGPDAFLKQLDILRKQDQDRRILPSERAAGAK